MNPGGKMNLPGYEHHDVDCATQYGKQCDCPAHPKARSQMKIEAQGEMKPGEYKIVAMADGMVHLRIHPVEFVMEPDNADGAARALMVAAKIARLVQAERKKIKPDATDAEIAAHLEKVFSG